MNSKVLGLGLTVVLFGWFLVPLANEVDSWFDYGIPDWALLLAAFAVSALTAAKLVPAVRAEAEPSVLLVRLLLVSAASFLLMKLSVLFGLSFFYRLFAWLSYRAETWALVLTTLLVLPWLRPRALLFVGLLAFTWRFQAMMVIAPLAFYIPELLQDAISLAVAVAIARSFCVGPASPAVRARRSSLNGFATAGTAVLILSAEESLLRPWQEKLIWIGFLASFLWLVETLVRDEPPSPAKQTSANPLHLILVGIGWTVVVAVVFNGYRMVEAWVPYDWGIRSQLWGPVFACAIVALGIMKLMHLGARLPDPPAGRKALLWGCILGAVAFVSGGGLFRFLTFDGGRGELSGAMIMISAYLMVPLMCLSLILLGTGLLRASFALDNRPRA